MQWKGRRIYPIAELLDQLVVFHGGSKLTTRWSFYLARSWSWDRALPLAILIYVRIGHNSREGKPGVEYYAI